MFDIMFANMIDNSLVCSVMNTMYHCFSPTIRTFFYLFLFLFSITNLYIHSIHTIHFKTNIIIPISFFRMNSSMYSNVNRL
jgi:hypothetical protein